LNCASLVVCDGIGVLWASKVLGSPLKQKITGTDLMGALCDRASKKGYRVFLLGAEEGVADKTAEVLRTKFKGLKVLGSLSGSPRVEDDAKTVRQIKDLVGESRIDGSSINSKSGVGVALQVGDSTVTLAAAVGSAAVCGGCFGEKGR